MKIEMIDQKGLKRLKGLQKKRQGVAADVLGSVRSIISDVQARGDQALFEYTERFDRIDLAGEGALVPEDQWQASEGRLSDDLIEAIALAKHNIERYQQDALTRIESQKTQGSQTVQSPSSEVYQTIRPLKRVGVYVPGGTAPLISTVLMAVLPAKIAGVQEIVVATPPDAQGQVHPALLYACQQCGVKQVYRMGGAQAIAAMAYGTESVAPVDKIVGPGNSYVALAKKELYGQVDIDMVAGPSEILVLADDAANPEYVAADLMSQAEHDPQAAAFLICLSEAFAQKVIDAFEQQIPKQPRSAIIEQSWRNSSRVFVAESLDCAIAAANILAPEHLELMLEDPQVALPKIENAGAIFCGAYTPESVGDYVAGPSHVLPTAGTARFYSPLGVEDFCKRTSVVHYSQSKFQDEASAVMQLARAEGLEAHARAVQVRLGDN